MPSIKDSFEECLQGENAIIKYIILATPLFICTKFIVEPDKTDYFVMTALITAVLLIGFCLKCTSNTRSNSNALLPSFNVFPLLFNGLRGIIVLAPLFIIANTLNFFITDFLGKTITNPQLLNVYSIITTGICYSIVCTGYILFARRFRASDVYDIKKISTYCVDILIAILFMELQVFIVDILVGGPMTYLVWLFFGLPHPIATFIWCVILVFDLALMSHYMAQIDYETIREDDDKI